MIPAVVIAAGLGTRLRPLTERYAKPVLPVDGTPIIAHLLRELAAAGAPHVTVVTGYRPEQIEQLIGDGGGFGVDVAYARQSEPERSASAVVAARATAPYLVLGADLVFAPGEIGRFAAAYGGSDAAGAIAVQPRPGTVEVDDGRALACSARACSGCRCRRSARPSPPAIEALPGRRPFELSTAFQQAIDAGEEIAAIEVGPARGLTTPFDLIEHNFPYLRSL